MSIEKPTQPFRLTPADRQSQTWARLRTHLNERLQSMRAQNDGDLDPVATAKMRGRIAEIKAMLALEQDLPQIPDGRE